MPRASRPLRYALLVAAVLAAGMLGACGGEQPPPPPSQSPQSPPPQTPNPPFPSPPVPSPSVPPRTERVVTDLHLLDGESDRVYENVTFRSTGRYQTATITIKNAHDIVFRDCVVEGGAWNAITINDIDRSVYNVRFENVYVKRTGRMGFECTARGSVGYENIVLDGITIEPSGSEAISFDGPGHDVVISDATILGSGTDRSYHGQGFEINGSSDFTIDGLTIYQTRGSAFNLNGPTGRPSGWTFTDVVADMTVSNQDVPQEHTSQVLYARNMSGATWSNTYIRAASPGGGVAYLDSCSDNDFRGVRWYDERGGHWATPRLVGSSSGNLFAGQPSAASAGALAAGDPAAALRSASVLSD